MLSGIKLEICVWSTSNVHHATVFGQSRRSLKCVGILVMFGLPFHLQGQELTQSYQKTVTFC